MDRTCNREPASSRSVASRRARTVRARGSEPELERAVPVRIDRAAGSVPVVVIDAMLDDVTLGAEDGDEAYEAIEVTSAEPGRVELVQDIPTGHATPRTLEVTMLLEPGELASEVREPVLRRVEPAMLVQRLAELLEAAADGRLLVIDAGEPRR